AAFAQALPWAIGSVALLLVAPPPSLAVVVLALAAWAGTATAMRGMFLPFVTATATMLAPLSAVLIASGGLWLTTALAVLAAATLAGIAAWANERALQQALETAREQAARAAEAEVQLEQARNRAAAVERASQEKTRFVASVSHDLRQPIHAVGLFVAALREQQHAPQAQALIERLERAIRGLDDLFDRLLDIGRLDSGRVTPNLSPFQVAPLMQTLESRFAALAEQRSLRFRVRVVGQHAVRSDPALLTEVLMNLLSNAFRYTHRGGILLAARPRGDRVLFQIWDTGEGIDAQHQATIFDEFVQLDSTSPDRRKGMGLGLAIVRRLCDALGCEISLRSVRGRGSVFEVAVPATVEAPAQTRFPGAPSDMSALGGTLVLVVDDDVDILIGMKAVLTHWDCFVLLARGIDEALRDIEASERFPDLLITDHQLGDGVTSADVVAAVQQAVPLRLPVLVISGEASAELEQSVRARGWAFLHKPVNPARLGEALSAMLAR
ncbi:MAG: response regulator, partial [Burkholderiales bacterium]